MGLFSGKDKTQVATQVQRVIEDKHLPHAVRDGVVRNLFDADGGGNQMMEYVFDELTNSIGLRAGRMYDYGKNGYMFGLPQSTLYSSQAGKEASKAAISAQVGSPVNLSYYHFGPLNNLHLAWMVLVQQHGYDSITNRLGALTAAKGQPVYLFDMQVVVTNATLEESMNGSLDQWGTPASAGPAPGRTTVALGQPAQTPFAVDPAAAGDYVRIDYAWEEPVVVKVEGVDVTKKERRQGSFTISVTGYDMQADYHQARYIGGDGRAGYWIYRAGAGTNPAVDAVFETAYNGSGSFFPFGYFRFNKKSTVDDPTSAEYKSSKKLFHYLNMDFETIGASINSNPDIKDVEQAMVMMAVPANTSNLMEQRYLFDFFSGIQIDTAGAANNTDFPVMADIKLELQEVRPRTSIVIQDKRFKMALSFSNISKRKMGGSIGKPGTYASGTNANDTMVNVPMIGGGTLAYSASTPRHWYRHQLTESVYEEVQVFDLQMTYWIFEQYTTTGNGTDEILLIPIDVAITERYSVPDREKLYARALHYVFNSRVITHLQWYQTGVFQILMIIVAIVVTILSDGAAWQSVVAAASAGAAALVTILIQMALKYILMNLAFRLFVKVVGVKFAMLAAIVAAIAGMYQVIDAGSLAGAPWATELLTISSGLSNGVSAKVKSDFNDLLGEQSEFEQYVKDQTKLLEAAEDLLDGTSLNPLLVFGETPNDFYQRTVHSGNIGVLGIDAVSNYVDIALQLPKISQTLGEHSYV